MDPEIVHQRLPLWVEHVRRHLVRRLGASRAAADVAQEAGARLLQVLASGVELREPRAWLFRVAQNLAADEARRRAPQPLGLEWQVALPDPRVEEDDTPIYSVGGSEWARDEMLELLPAALARLPARDRGWLLGFYQAGASCESLAREHGVSLEASKVRLHRARRRLARVIQHAATLRRAEQAAACALLAACAPSEARVVEETARAAPAAIASVAMESQDATASATLIAAEADSAADQLEVARALRAAAAGRRGPERALGLEAAAAAYARVAARWPEAQDACVEAHFRRGEILRILEREGEAYGAFLEAVDAAGPGGSAATATRARLELGRLQRRSGNLMAAVGWLEGVAGEVAAPLRLRNDAREELAAIRFALGQWADAVATASAWRADAESAAEEARAAHLLVRALRRDGCAEAAQSTLDEAIVRAGALAQDDSPEGRAAARALQELRELAGAESTEERR